MNYTKLSLSDVHTAFLDVARDAQQTFGMLDSRQLNWRPDLARWSVAQCFDHLVVCNRLMLEGARTALTTPSRGVWTRLPLVPRLFGPMMIRSQGPVVKHKLTTPARIRPAASEISADIIQRFADQQCAAAEWVKTLDEGVVGRARMASPFAKIVIYTVLDGIRLMVAHDHRHFEQARRVMSSPGFGS